MLLNLDQIQIGNRLRSPRPERVIALAESITKLGLQTPISVASGVLKQAGGGSGVSFSLVAGLHRLEACRSLGWSEIAATIVQMDDDERLLWEIDENLCRADLTELERGEHLLKRKEVYERKWPQTRQHIAGAVARHAAADSAVAPSFAADTATKADLAERTIRQSIRRVRKIDEKVRDRIRDNPEIADSGVELDALADLDPQEQRKAVALVEAGQAVGIRDARKLMERKATQVAPQFKEAEISRQKRRDAFVRTWNALDETDREWATTEIIGAGSIVWETLT